MNTIEFLRAILPEEGFKFLAVAREGRGGLAHKAFESLEQMAEAIVRMDANPADNIYHACAAYKAASFDENGKKKYRGPANWLGAKAFWCDIDCGEKKAAEGKGYLTKRDAYIAIVGFCAAQGLPKPMVVDSGGGIHCYWPLTRMVGPKSWRVLAAHFKAALAGHGIIADPTRTADLSSVLRPAGSSNRKPGRDVRTVTVKSLPNPVTPEEFAAAVQAASAGLQVYEPSQPPVPGLNDDLTGHLGPQLESSAELVANSCQQVRMMRDTQGAVEYEHWRGVIGIIKHCVEGKELAHAWSQGAANYDPASVDVRFDTWSTPPTLCSHFQQANPSGCQGCPHAGKIKTPIVLGRIMPEPAEQEVEVQDENEQLVTTTVPALPESFVFDGGMMARMMPDKEGNLQAHPFCLSLFYPIKRIKKEDATFGMTMRMHLPDQRVRDFEVDTGTLNGGTDLLKALTRYELMPTNNKDAGMHMTAYVRDSIRKLMSEQREVDTLVAFGWQNGTKEFLLGDRLYMADGTMRKVFIGGGAAEHMAALPEPRGSLAAYSDAVNFVYARPQNEPLQYAFCNTYGSLLTPFGEDSYNGLLMCITSGKSGRGKTTVGQAARYGLGDAAKLMFSGKSGATWNSRWHLLGTFRNIPVVFDEMTDMEASTFSEMAYTISQGSDKSRLKSVGGKVGFADRQSWAQSPDLTANEDMLSKLAQHNANTQAEAMRMVQINLSRYNVPMIEPSSLVATELDKMHANMGNAGHAFISHVVSHQDNVRAIFKALAQELSDELPESEYRFYRNHAACTLTAARVLIDLGIVEFDFEALKAFSFDLLRDLAMQVKTSNVTTPGDALSRMVRENSNRFIVTTNYRDTRTDARGPEESLQRVQGAPMGRRVLGIASPNSTEKVDPQYLGRLFISRKEMHDWCSKNRLEAGDLLAHAQTAGFLVPWNERFNLGRGTVHSTGSCPVYCFDYAAMEGAVENTSGPALAPTGLRKVVSGR